MSTLLEYAGGYYSSAMGFWLSILTMSTDLFLGFFIMVEALSLDNSPDMHGILRNDARVANTAAWHVKALRPEHGSETPVSGE
ncbi:MAG: hypothetical protein LDL33_07140 [Desulfomonile sp.]|nr:hypothetical protein [Desulfomonile sp.]